MPSLLDRSRSARVLCAVAAVAAAGCGTSRTDVSPAVDSFNKEVAADRVKLDCPKEVEGDRFDCDMVGLDTDKRETVKMKLVGENKDTVDIADERGFERAVRTVLEKG